jgi:hypothetical protein
MFLNAGDLWGDEGALATLVDRSDVCVQRLLGGLRELGYIGAATSLL